MRISIFGLGYVGAVSAGCLAADGHTVIGVDPNATKVKLINDGITPIIEKDIGDIIAKAVAGKRLWATTDVAAAINDSELSIVCVGTPSERNGSLDLRYIRRSCEEIGQALRNKSGWHNVTIRSTILPGTMRNIIIPMLDESSGKKAGVDFGVCNNPEFLREGTAVFDYRNPPKTVIGEIDTRSGDVLAGLYAHLQAPLIRTGVETAEMVKYVDNVWHAVKVAFANEIGNICKPLKIDSHEVMGIFCQDTKLNLSPYYLKPGFAFGGSCLPKDLRALSYKAKALDLELPLLASVLPSNELQIDRAFKLITDQNVKKISVLGFSFKEGTDDLRESPIVELVERLIGKGADLRLYDKNVSLAALTGANRDYILNHIPHISRLMVDNVNAAIDHGELIIIGNKSPEFVEVIDKIPSHKHIIDLVRITIKARPVANYEGICW
ncbi:MAG: nucleotide sugar dehydrogenase [Burkholderiales bacterium]|nr:nucleotide sugar dehydrogenase [Pseudomonadota bacterium]